MNLEKTAYSLLKTWIMMRKCTLSTMERRLTSLAITSDSEDQVPIRLRAPSLSFLAVSWTVCLLNYQSTIVLHSN